MIQHMPHALRNKKSKYEFIYEFENDNFEVNLLKYLLIIQLSKKRILRTITQT